MGQGQPALCVCCGGEYEREDGKTADDVDGFWKWWACDTDGSKKQAVMRALSHLPSMDEESAERVWVKVQLGVKPDWLNKEWA